MSDRRRARALALVAGLATGAVCFAPGVAAQHAPPIATAPPESDPALRGHGGPIRALAVLDDTTVATGGFDAAIIVWDVARRSARHVLRRHDGTVNALLPLPDGCLVSGGEDGRIARWCGVATRPAHEVSGDGPAPRGPVAALAISRDGAWLASGAWSREVRLWPTIATVAGGTRDSDLEPGRVIAEHKAPVTGVAFASDGRAIISVGYDGEVRLTSLGGGIDRAGEPPRLLRQTQLPAAINGLTLLPEGRIVLTSADGRVRVLKPDLTADFEIELPDGPLTAVAVSPDGTMIAAAGMRTPVALIDVGRRQAARRILGPGLPVWALAFSRDGRHLFTGGADRALRQWTVATGEPVGDPVAPPADMLPATADRHPGARVFRACVACHATGPDDGHRAGPTLHGIMGRRIGTAAGYAYSDALRSMDIIWTPETVARLFEIGPAAMTPGTKMPEQRVTDPADRRALVEWLAEATRRPP
ncbi:MAG: c-type cytochrome [Hyphomicrobiaceae bacterium]